MIVAAAATVLAAGALLGWLTFTTIAGEKKPELGAKTDSPFTPAQLAERTLHRRAVDAVIWGMPAVNSDLMYQAMVREAKVGPTRSSTGRACRIGITRRSPRTPT